jgi:chromosome segregation ATPase
MMAMPMMPMMIGQVSTARAVSFEEPRSRGVERSCEGTQDRIDELDARVEALNLRMKTIQRSLEIQTRILEELRAQGTIGGQKLGAPPAPPPE